MRGKRRRLAPSPLRQRITPADAGKTRRQSRKSVTARDHPRGCGENNRDRTQSGARTGSPPRMRGKQSHGQERFAPVRITPADAGKTTTSNFVIFLSPDHPRGCGENSAFLTSFARIRGSPPRMRGKQRPFLGGYLPHGITPAGAGKTLWAICSKVIKVGSPPQVRGKPNSETRAVITCRITPAGAGKTYIPCGCDRLGRGSPPQVRGKRHSNLYAVR